MNIAIIFAGGVGSRMGSDTPKQFLEFNNKPVLIWTLEVFESHKDIDAIVLACKEEWIDHTKNLIARYNLKKVVSVIPGGATALDSQYNALVETRKLYPNKDVNVLIHDGVRPLVDAETISKNIESVNKFGNAITVSNAIETVIKIDESNNIIDILDRDFCRVAKAPQSFKLDDILAVHERSIKEDNHLFIDSASMMRAYGYELFTVNGEPENIKITTPSDYYMFMGISESKK